MTIPAALRTLTVDETAEALRVSRSWVYRAINEGVIRAHRIGRGLRVREESLRAYLDATRLDPAVRKPEALDPDALIARLRRTG